jgi:hypothetical protein
LRARVTAGTHVGKDVATSYAVKTPNGILRNRASQLIIVSEEPSRVLNPETFFLHHEIGHLSSIGDSTYITLA